MKLDPVTQVTILELSEAQRARLDASVEELADEWSTVQELGLV